MNRHLLMHLPRLSAVALLGMGFVAATACRPAAPAAGPAVSSTQPAVPGAAVLPAQTALAAAPAVTPVAVNCGPGQQVLIRPAVIDGQAVSQVDCVAASGYPAQAAVAPRAVPVPLMASLDDDPRVAGRPTYRGAARTAGYRTAEYEPVPVRRTQSGRTWKKSAVIIGSSAGIGAAVGAAVKGKKGALIGAAIGGGGATIWDQVTRRRE